MALNEWGLMAYLPSDYYSLLGASSKVDPLECLKLIISYELDELHY